MPEIVSVYDFADLAKAWTATPVLYAHPEGRDRLRVFLLGEEEALVAFFEAEGMAFTDARALDPAWWRNAASGPCKVYIGVHIPQPKRGQRPRRRKDRNRNRQKWGRLKGYHLVHHCVGTCPRTGETCQAVNIGHGHWRCVCQ